MLLYVHLIMHLINKNIAANNNTHTLEITFIKSFNK